MPKDRRVPTKNRDLETWLYSDPYESAVAVGNSTKRRKKSTSRVQPSPTTIPDLIPPPGPPPPVSCAKTDTIFAQNPFDDQPLSRGNMQNKQLMSHSQAVGGPPGHSGKVYPPNKSMVFNPANPNAPPIYPCGICHKEVHDSDQAILCESGCNFWFHRICTGLTEDAFHLLRAEVYAEWVCDKCLSTKNIPLVKMKP